MFDLEAMDQGVQHPFRHVQWPWFQFIMITITYLGELAVILGVLLMAGVWLFRQGRLRQVKALVAIMLIALTLNHATKLLVNRPRSNIGWAPLPMPETPSFPSGHALLATALYGTLGIYFSRNAGPGLRRRLFRLAGVLLPFLIGSSRLCIGHNYLTDVLAGWLAGAALVLTAGWLAEDDPVAASVQPGGAAA